jgi:hypothetical protein
MTKEKVQKEEKVPKPKMLFKLIIEMYDNGHVGKDMTEYRLDEEIQKRRRFNHETSSDFREAIRAELAQNDDVLARDILISLGIDPKVFAQKTLNLPVTNPEEVKQQA